MQHYFIANVAEIFFPNYRYYRLCIDKNICFLLLRTVWEYPRWAAFFAVYAIYIYYLQCLQLRDGETGEGPRSSSRKCRGCTFLRVLLCYNATGMLWFTTGVPGDTGGRTVTFYGEFPPRDRDGLGHLAPYSLWPSTGKNFGPKNNNFSGWCADKFCPLLYGVFRFVKSPNPWGSNIKKVKK